MPEQILEHTYKLKGGEQSAVERNNPLLQRREPVVVYCTDGITRMKIGDGIHKYNELDWVKVEGDTSGNGATEILTYNTKSQFPLVGDSNFLYRAYAEASLYQWNANRRKYEPLAVVDTSDIKLMATDDVSIISNNNVLELNNFSSALANQIPHKDETGKLVWKDICLRRDNDYNFRHINLVPQKGELLFVDTAREGLRIKCGDGHTSYVDLPFEDEAYLKGYYKDNEFYSSKLYDIKLICVTNKLYLDLDSNNIYFYDGTSFVCTVSKNGDKLPSASSTEAGILKLYNTTGQNVDGTMTQKAITEELGEKVEIDVNLDEEILIFTN